MGYNILIVSNYLNEAWQDFLVVLRTSLPETFVTFSLLSGATSPLVCAQGQYCQGLG